MLKKEKYLEINPGFCYIKIIEKGVVGICGADVYEIVSTVNLIFRQG
ncbi:MAG: hypothetical protein ACI39W_00100 [Brotaphodocola sp.]